VETKGRKEEQQVNVQDVHQVVVEEVPSQDEQIHLSIPVPPSTAPVDQPGLLSNPFPLPAVEKPTWIRKRPVKDNKMADFIYGTSEFKDPVHVSLERICSLNLVEKASVQGQEGIDSYIRLELEDLLNYGAFEPVHISKELEGKTIIHGRMFSRKRWMPTTCLKGTKLGMLREGTRGKTSLL
jgi:hypothetical protein